MQSLINIMECQLEEAFEAAQGGAAGGRKQSVSKSKASAAGGAESGATLDPKVRLSTNHAEGTRSHGGHYTMSEHRWCARRWDGSKQATDTNIAANFTPRAPRDFFSAPLRR